MTVVDVFVGLDTLVAGEAFLLGGSAYIVLGGEAAPIEAGKIACARLADGVVQLLNGGSVVVSAPLTVGY